MPRLRAGDLVRVVITIGGHRQIGLAGDSLVGEHEIVMNPLGEIGGQDRLSCPKGSPSVS